MDDLALLRRYEPVVCYTQGELFFPCAVEDYLRHCSLWIAGDQQTRTQLAAPGELTPELLGRYGDIPAGSRLYLQFVAEPMDALALQRWRRQPQRPRFRNPNRLERVGLISRLLEGLFDAALLLRGRVPGGTVAVAEAQYKAALPASDSGLPRRVYYARVLRQAGYIILHYIYFYAMNDWRSSFHGVNDHESDWEQVFVYLSQEAEGEPVPRWVAYASHDFAGDDLRRRWDDPELQKVNEIHPVIFAGAGSHASYFSRGEYLMHETPRFMEQARRGARLLDRFWTQTLQQSDSLGLEQMMVSLTSIPFVDYARGDGRRIGSGQPEVWTPVLISDADGWVHGYRGLWGLETWDPMGGERAPGGPKYDRDGTVRLSWSDPLAWAGLDKVPPPAQHIASLEQLLAQLEQTQVGLAAARDKQRETLREWQLQVDALSQDAYHGRLLAERRSILMREGEKYRELATRLGANQETIQALREHLARLREGDFGPPRAHIHHAHTPQPPLPARSRLVRLWSACSGGLLLIVIVLIVIFPPPQWPLWLVGAALAFGAIEALAQNRLLTYALDVTIGLAIITALILLWEFWWLVLALAIAALVLLTVRDNLRELSS